MRIKVDIDTTNIALTETEKLGIDVNKRINHTVAFKVIDELSDKIDCDNIFKEHKIITKSVKLDVYNSSTIDLVKQKIEALVGLPLAYKVEILNLLDDDLMFKQCHFISNILKGIITDQNQSKLEYFFRKQFEFRVQVDKITAEDIKILFEDIFNETFINHELMYDNFINKYSIGFLKNNQNYYYQNDVFTFLTKLQNYK